MRTWYIIESAPLCGDWWAQIEVKNEDFYGIPMGEARLVGTDKWYHLILTECRGEVLQNLRGGAFIDTGVTYRAADSELVKLANNYDDSIITRIAIRGRLAKVNLFGKTVTLL